MPTIYISRSRSISIGSPHERITAICYYLVPTQGLRQSRLGCLGGGHLPCRLSVSGRRIITSKPTTCVPSVMGVIGTEQGMKAPTGSRCSASSSDPPNVLAGLLDVFANPA